MARLKFFNRPENEIHQSEIHQKLGDAKIQEICDRHLLQEEGKEIINKFLERLKVDGLVKNKDSILEFIEQEINNHPEKEKIEKIQRVIRDISELFIYTEQLKQKFSVVLERRLVCLSPNVWRV